ncbi:hypothetical protein NBH00_05260 [Paraconexibacter antarcticus]|uniref:Uncharacterized protein n=1 Tax=Paraconexibacter antarcticus TaxID=2949664 RepID=A0ABY5DYH1_9ACTN|nr:hypothetical protein [Paraconexibacter antarcticus]UTI65619.1 hypothetical protein NBH00_05260 [Paraconexibacter antarcticus]
MPAERTVRVSRTWDLKVTAEYGDTDETLVEKAVVTDADEPSETRNLLPED